MANRKGKKRPHYRETPTRFDMPTYWTPEQALAVFELIDDLRDRIWAAYQPALQDLIRDQRQPEPADRFVFDDDLPF